MSGDHTHEDVRFCPRIFEVREGSENVLDVSSYGPSPDDGELILVLRNGYKHLAIASSHYETLPRGYGWTYTVEFLT